MGKNSRLQHLAHAGVMGKIIASFNWSHTSLGDSSTWPSILITTLSMVLENKFPMYLIWEKEQIHFHKRVLG